MADAAQSEADRRRVARAAGGASAVGVQAQQQQPPAREQQPSAAERAAAAAAIGTALLAFFDDRQQRQESWLRAQLGRLTNVRVIAFTGTRGAPDREGVIEQVLAEERAREAEFVSRQADRVMRKVTAALAAPGQRSREDAVQGVLAREQFILRQRSEAMAARAFAAVDRIALHFESPQGAYWQLDPLVREHTLGCLLMGGKFWPWQVLDRVHPPRHPGCPCRLRSYGDAIAEGLMGPGDVLDVRSAIRTAAHVVMEGAIEVGDDPAGLRDLLFEASTIELGDQLVEAGFASLGGVELVRERLVLGVERAAPELVREQLGALGIGQDDQGFFVYSHEARSRSFPSMEEIDMRVVQEAV